MNDEQNERYNRQILLNNFGEAAQEKLLAAKVLVIGAGGLGCPVLQYLAASGVGTIGIVDGDKISLSNLQRQLLYSTDDIGKYKTAVSALRLRQINPGITINEHQVFINNKNAFAILNGYDIIVDGTDNFATRYLINDACLLLNKPLVFGAVYQYEGQVAIFNVSDNNGVKINYRHLFPVPPTISESPDCATAGVLGVLPGIIGLMQATEAIKLITGISESLINKILTYNALNNETFTVDLTAAFDTEISMPKDETAFENMNYEAFCNSILNEIKQINANAFYTLLQDENVAIIDVREVWEKPVASFRNQQIPLSIFLDKMHEIESDSVVLFCQSGMRSLKAAELLLNHFKNQKSIYNLKGGILSL